ncbi:unnamed protein product, partial [Symbiodinium microadriaticum]
LGLLHGLRDGLGDRPYRGDRSRRLRGLLGHLCPAHRAQLQSDGGIGCRPPGSRGEGSQEAGRPRAGQGGQETRQLEPGGGGGGRWGRARSDRRRSGGSSRRPGRTATPKGSHPGRRTACWWRHAELRFVHGRKQCLPALLHPDHLRE